MKIIDTHLHLVDQHRFSYPWLGNAPALNRNWSAENYFAEASRLGIEQALHMEVDVADEHMLAETEAMLQATPRIAGAIAAARPEQAGFAQHLERLAVLSGVKGVRRILHTVPDELSRSSLFAENVRRLPESGFTFDLCLRADQLTPIGTELVDKAPEVQFILDHCGVPDIAGGAFEIWRDGITSIAQRPNVVVKLSGIVAYCAPDWTVQTLRPYFDHIVQSFGFDRMVWGSDHPVCTTTATLTRWVVATNALLTDAGETERSAVLHRNAQRIYRLNT